MYSIHNRDDLEKLKKMQESKSLLKAERLKQLLGKKDFHYDMEEVFEPVTENQKKSQNKTKLESEKKNNYKRYVILLKLQHKQYENRVTL